MRHPGARRLLACVVLSCLLPLAACATEQAPPSSAGPALTASTGFRLALPFDQYKWNPRESWIRDQARYRLLRNCVQGRGVTFTMPEQKRTVEPDDAYDNSRRYGALDEAAVSLFGYHLPRTADGTRRQEEIDRWNKSVSKAEETAIYGADGKSGCYAQADAELAAGVPEADTAWLGKQSSASLKEAEKTSGVAHAKDVWHGCMAKLGYDYADSDTALEDPRWNLESPSISDQERATALADVRCKFSSGLVTAWQDTETAWQHEVVDREPARFAQLAAAKKAALAIASRLGL